MGQITQFRFEVDGDQNDYADCVHNVFAKDIKEAFRKWNETDGRYVKRWQEVKTIRV